MGDTKDEISAQAFSESQQVEGPSNTSLVVFMGLPASGKSTVAQNLLQFSKTWKTIMISFDDYVPLTVQEKLSQQEIDNGSEAEECSTLSQAKITRKKFVDCVSTVIKYVHQAEKTNMYDSICKSLEECLQSLKVSLSLHGSVDLITDQSFLSKTGEILKSYSSLFSSKSFERDSSVKNVVIVDDNNYYKSMRSDFYQISKLNEIGFCVIYCKTPLAICVNRNAQRAVESQVPHKVIVQMSLKLEEPNPMQTPFDMYCIEVDCGSSDSQANLSLIQGIVDSSFNNPLKQSYDRKEEIERERKICSESEVHQADLLLRKWISKKLTLSSFTANGKSASAQDKKILSKELNLRKKVTLDKLRSGELKISYEVHQDVEFHKEIVKMFENVTVK